MAQVVVILMGLQASGKSSFVAAHLKGYTHISKDHFPNARRPAKRQQRLLEEALAGEESIVVDNTNPTRADRAPIIAAAKLASVKVIGYYFESTVKKCKARNAKRLGKACVPDIAIHATVAKLEHPSYEEGFDELHFVRLKKGKFVIEPWREK